MLGEWWVWASAAGVFAILEMLAPAYIFLGFSLGAVVMALIVVFGILLGASKMLVLYAVISLVAWLALRKFFPHSAGSVKVWKKDINE